MTGRDNSRRIAEGEGWPLTFPLAPFLSRAAGEEGGMVGSRTFLLAPSRNGCAGTVRSQ